METINVGSLGDECCVCGRHYRHRFQLNEDKRVTKLLTMHNECVEVTKRMKQIKEQIKELERKLIDEEFTLFTIRMSKNECDY